MDFSLYRNTNYLLYTFIAFVNEIILTYLFFSVNTRIYNYHVLIVCYKKKCYNHVIYSVLILHNIQYSQTEKTDETANNKTDIKNI